MMKDVLLGALITSAITTQTGRQAVVSASKIGLKILESNLKTNYNIDLKQVLNENKIVAESEGNEYEHSLQ